MEREIKREIKRETERSIKIKAKEEMVLIIL